MMADEENTEEEKKGGSKKGLLIGLVLAIVGGGAAFAFTSGMLGGGGEEKKEAHDESKDLAFVALDPLTVQIGEASQPRYLFFSAQLEVKADATESVTKMVPRVMDVMNTYLQSVSLEDVEDPSALLMLRSQMRRRIDLVVGEGKVNDLLVMEFVVK